MSDFIYYRSRFSSSQADHEDLLLEHEQLSSRHEQLLQEAEERRERLEKAMKDEASRHSLQSQEQTELIIQLRHEMEEMAVIFKTQLNSLQEEHAKVSREHGSWNKFQLTPKNWTRFCRCGYIEPI